MTKEQQMVLEFHKKFGAVINEVPTVPDVSTCELRTKLIQEELTELEQAFRDEDIVEIADALGDLLYVVYGAGISCGIDLDPIYQEIHRSNLTKVWPDGEVRRNEFGKILKPPIYSTPNLEPLLDIQRKYATKSPS